MTVARMPSKDSSAVGIIAAPAALDGKPAQPIWFTRPEPAPHTSGDEDPGEKKKPVRWLKTP